MKNLIIKAALFVAKRTTKHLFTTTLGTMVVMVTMWSVISQGTSWTDAQYGIAAGAALIISKDPFKP